MTRNAIIHLVVQAYLSKTDLYNVTEYGTRPCKILFPKIFENNIHMMKMILDDSVIDYRIYFANKATKDDTFIKTAKKQDI
jgi:diaminopimelate decarboxylase